MSGEPRSLLALLGDEVVHLVEPLLAAARDPADLAELAWRARWTLPELTG